MNDKVATVIGATGMIGRLLYQQLLNDPFYDRVRILVRRPVEDAHEKLEVKLVNFEDTEWLKLSLEESFVLFSCIGTTNQQVRGNKELYWKIDHDIPVRACKLAKEVGCQKFVMVSSVGANPRSSNFYLKMKGETENDIIATAMPQIHIMQPSFLLGKRSERRPLEAFGQGLFEPLSKLLPGSMQKYKAIEGIVVAKAMIAASKKSKSGHFRYTHNELVKLAAEV